MNSQKTSTENNNTGKGVTIYSLTTSPTGSKKDISVGTAQMFEGEKHYRLKLNMFPDRRFFLSKKRKGSSYTVYSEIRSRKNGSTRLRRPVGFGVLSEALKGHLKICFNFPRSSIFMSLYPKREIMGGVA